MQPHRVDYRQYPDEHVRDAREQGEDGCRCLVIAEEIGHPHEPVAVGEVCDAPHDKEHGDACRPEIEYELAALVFHGYHVGQEERVQARRYPQDHQAGADSDSQSSLVPVISDNRYPVAVEMILVMRFSVTPIMISMWFSHWKNTCHFSASGISLRLNRKSFRRGG